MSDRAALDALRALVQRSPASAPPPAAWKVAINFAAVQTRLGLTHALAAPIAGLTTHESGRELASAPERLLHVEAEIAIRLGSDLDASSTDEELRASIESYAPCLELVDYAQARNSLSAMFDHAFFHAGVVLGTSVPRDAFAGLPVRWPTATNAEGKQHARIEGTVPADLTDALRGVLARALEAGTQLHRGQLILCGSYIEPIPLTPGTRLRVDYGPEHPALQIARSAI